MKTKILMPLALALGVSLSAMAQKHEHKGLSPEERATKMTEKMTEKLSLTDEQKTAVYDANLALAKEQKRATDARKQAVQAHEAALKKTLTEEQYNTFTNMRKERRENRTERRAHRTEHRSEK